MNSDQSFTSANLQVALYNNHAHYQHLYDLIAELKSYGAYQAGSDEPLDEDLQEKVDQTIVDYLNGTHLFMCFNPEIKAQSKVFPPEGSLCGLLSLSIKEIPVKDNKNAIDPMQSTMLTIAALKGAMQSASKGDFDLSSHFKAISDLNPHLTVDHEGGDTKHVTSEVNSEVTSEDLNIVHDPVFDHISSDDLKAKVAAAEATLAALNALNEQKAAAAQALEQTDNDKVAEVDNEHQADKAQQYCYINRVYIRPQERNQGAATKLLQQAIDFAKEQECQQIILSTIATYQSALNLYHKLGFEELNPNTLPENLKVKARTLYLGINLNH